MRIRFTDFGDMLLPGRYTVRGANDVAHPFHSAAHKNDPQWLRGLDKHVESNANPSYEKAKVADVDTALKNYGGDPAVTHAAADYGRPKQQDD